VATRLYGIVWRWHFLAGVVACPILFVVAMTGALWAFQPELDRWANPELLVVEPGPELVPVDDLLATAKQHCTPVGMTLPGFVDAPARVYCAEGERREIYLDPYRGTVLGERDATSSFFSVVFSLHYELMLGRPGRLAIDWATTWTMLLLASGAVLWWPRGKRRGGGVWWPRRGVRGRQLLRDLHAVGGMYFLPVMFAITASGLMWTVWTGNSRWHPLTEDAVHETWDHPPSSTVIPGAPRLGTDAALAAAGIDRATERRAIFFWDKRAQPDSSYAFFLFDPAYASASKTELVWIDAYSGDEIERLTNADRSAIGKIDGVLYGIHIGSILGLPGRILACLAALLLAALCVTGPWMWWKRRPRGKVGVPPAKRTSWGLLAALVGIGVLLPMVLVTLAGVILLEGIAWLWRSRATAAPPPGSPG